MTHTLAWGRIAALAAAVAALAPALVSCASDDPAPAPPAAPVSVKLIAMNDFHGNFEVPAANNGGSVIVKDPANAAGTSVRTGGAAYLATLVAQLKAKNPNNVVVAAGDMISASPVASSLTHDEATVDILGQVGLEVSSVGNHEFDHGKDELLRIQNGGCYPGGVTGTDTCLVNGSFPGAKYKYLSANTVVTATGQTLFPATWTKRFGAASVGFIGLTLKGTPSVVTSTGVAGLSFTDEVTTINARAAELKAQGATAVVVLIHQGGQTTASTLDDGSCPNLSGEIVPIVDGLTKDVDVVVSGHTHQEYVCRRNGKLLTSTGFYGSAVTEIDLTLQPGSGVTAMTAHTVPVVNDLNTTLPAGMVALAPDATVAAQVQKYVALTATLKNTVAGTISADIKRALLSGTSTPTRDEGAEGALGDVMADVYLAGGPTSEIAFINPGGVRADLIRPASGQVTVGNLIDVAPFGNTLVTADLTGAQLKRLLEQQWEAANCAAKPSGANGCGRLLQPSAGFSYTWDAAQPAGAADGQGNRVVAGSMMLNGTAIDAAKTYRITFNSFMAPGPGDNFSVVTQGKNITNSQVKDIDALIAYMKTHPNLAPPAPRITRVN